MFPFLLLFIIFLLVLSYYNKKNSNSQKEVIENYLEQERLANSTLKKDISKLNYITIPFENFPQKFHTASEDCFFSFQNQKILNLSGISNTELKQTYGVSNLSLLSEYDENFCNLVSVLPKYALELMEIGEIDTAQKLLEFGVSCQADSRLIYKSLAEIYHSKGQPDKITALFNCASTLAPLPKAAIEKELQNYLP